MKHVIVFSGLAALLTLTASAGVINYNTTGSTLSCNGVAGCVQNTTTSVSTGGLTFTYNAGSGSSVVTPSIINLGNIVSTGTGTNVNVTGLLLTINVNSTPPGAGGTLPNGAISGSISTNNSGATILFSPNNTTTGFGTLPGVVISGGGQSFTYQILNPSLGLQAPTVGNPIGQTSIQGAVTDTSAVQTPSFSKSFTPSQVAPGGASTLTLTITNNGATALNGLAFTDTYPAGVTTASPSNLTNTCGGGAVATSGSVSLTNGTLNGPSGTTCAVTVRVLGATEGIKNNSATLTATNATSPSPATATLTVASPPTLSKNFSLVSMGVGGTTNLAFTLSNPNSSTSLTGLAFTDTLPAGLIVSTPNGLVSSCGGTITATAGGNTISLSGATLAAGASCSFSVSVTGTGSTLGQLTNTTSTVTSAQAVGAAATASIFIGDPFQVRYSSNLSIGDSVVNVSNVGTTSTAAFPTQNGNICANVYTFSPDEQLISCCSCLVTPNGLDSLSARNDLISNTLTPGVPTGIVVKLLSTVQTGACNAAAVTPGNLASGMVAWGTTIHAVPVTPATPAGTYGVTETRFSQASLSAAELTRITTLCGFIQSNGSGFGICRSCRLGGLGAGAQ